MTDAPNHWGDVASLLGVEPAPEEPKPQSAGPAPSQPKPTLPVAAPRAAAPRPPRPAANWDALAGSLGVAPAPAPPPAAKPPAAKPPAPRAAQPSVRPVTPPPAPPAFPPAMPRARYTPPEPVEIASPPADEPREPIESGAAEEFALLSEELVGFVPQSSDAEGPPERRRRKRRRRGRGPRDAAPAEQPTGSAPPESDDFTLELPEEEQPVEPGEPTAESRPERPERRRGRRGRSRGRDRGPVRDAAIPAPAVEDRPPLEEDLDDTTLDLPDPLGDETDDEASAAVGFHSIPTWEEAVGILVSANLESRARRPGNGAASGRGGNRGGRDRNRGGGNRGSRPRSANRR